MKKKEIFLIVVGLIFSFLMIQHQKVHNDNVQLMDKVVLIYNTNVWTHYGNLTTKMGSLPGSFLTVVTAVPMLIWKSPMAAGLVIILFHLLSYFLLRYVGQKYFPQFNPLYLAIFYWLNPWRVEQSEIYNPAYLYFFAALYIFCLFKLKDNKSFLYSFIITLTLGFCMQVHLSVLILGLSLLYLLIRKEIQLNWTAVSLGVFVIVLSLIPWLGSILNHETRSIATQSDAFIGKNLVLVYPVLKAIFYFFRMASLYCGRHIMTDINFEWLKLISIDVVQFKKYFEIGTKVILYAISILSLRYAFVYLYNKFKSVYFKLNIQFLDHILISFFVGLLVSSALSPVEFNHWHLILCFPVLMLLISIEPDKYFKNLWLRSKNNILIFCTLLFVVWNSLVILGSRSHDISVNYPEAFRERYQIK